MWITRIAASFYLGEVETAIEIGVERHAIARAQGDAGIGERRLLGQGTDLRVGKVWLAVLALDEEARAIDVEQASLLVVGPRDYDQLAFG